MSMRTLATFWLVCGIVSAQIFSAGIKAGIPFTDPFTDITAPSLFTTGQTVHAFNETQNIA